MGEQLSVRRTGRRWIGRGVTVVSGAYALMILIYFGLRLTIGESVDLVALGNSLMPVILIPAAFLLMAMLVGRRWAVAALLLPAVSVLVVGYGLRFVPGALRAQGSADDGVSTLSVLTYNIASKRADFERMVGIIREADADVVALQELLTPAAAAVEAALRDVYPYRILRPTDDFARGMGILSKYPVSNPQYFDAIILGSQRVHMTLADGEGVIFYNAHPVPPRTVGGFDSSTRSAEIAFLLADAAQFTDIPVIMAGDFNTTDQTGDYAHVRDAGFADAYAEVGFGMGPTFPNMTRWGGLMRVIPPMIRIDYVFYRGGCWTAEESRVIGETGGSDHYPVLVALGY